MNENEQSLNVFHLLCKRHDQDRVEINIGFDGLVKNHRGEFNYDLDLLFFVPKSLGLTEVDPIEILRNEFQSYFRLHSFTGLYSKEFTPSILLKRLHDLENSFSSNLLATFAIELDAYLKAQKRKFHKLYKKKLPQIPTSEELIESLSDMQAVMLQFRTLLDKNNVYEEVKKEISTNDTKKEMFLLNEYVSHLYIQVLWQLEVLANSNKQNTSLKNRVKEMVAQEARVREHYELSLAPSHSTSDSQNAFAFHMRKLSLLKKYFSHPLFVKHQENYLEKRMLLPVYGISAALAAAWAIMLQIYTVRSTIQSVGINTIAFISVGVIGYVIKDLLKDVFRRFFFKSSRRFFPDIENKLYISKNGSQRLLGTSKDFVKSLQTEDLSESVSAERYKGEMGIIEKVLGEDILHFKKRVSLNLKYLSGEDQFPWGFREIIRYRFDRIRVSMEDSKKSLPLPSKSGEIVLHDAHRTYKITMVVQIDANGQNKENVQGKVKAYELMLDKEGLLSCNSIPWSCALFSPNNDNNT